MGEGEFGFLHEKAFVALLNLSCEVDDGAAPRILMGFPGSKALSSWP